MASIAIFNDDGFVSGVIRVPDGTPDPTAFARSLGLLCSVARFTSYNSRFGGHYAAIGDAFDEAHGIYVVPQPFPSWCLDTETGYWSPPMPRPEDGGEYVWDETAGAWISVPPEPEEIPESDA